MSSSPTTFRIGGEIRLAEFLRDRSAKLQDRIDGELDEYVASIDEESYIESITKEYSLSVPRLEFENLTASTGKKLVPAERFPPNQFHVRKGVSYEKEVVIFHIPCEGDAGLLKYYGDNSVPENGPLGFIEGGELCFEIINFYGDLDRVKKRRDSIVQDIKTVTSKLFTELEQYNNNLKWSVSQRIRDRKQKIQHITQTLGVPIRKRQTAPPVSHLANQEQEMKSDLIYDVFLSYASADGKEASQIYDHIISAGGTVFLSEKTLRAGDDFEEAIRNALHASSELWLLLSPNSLRSEWVISEWGAAWALRKRIIPILLRCAPTDAPDRIRRLQCIDFHNCPQLAQERFPRQHSMKRRSFTAFEPWKADSSLPALSDTARDLLVEAAKDAHGMILRLDADDGLRIQTNGRQLVAKQTAREEAKWQAAVDQLLGFRLIQDQGYKGEVFQITDEGFRVADLIAQQLPS